MPAVNTALAETFVVHRAGGGDEILNVVAAFGSHIRGIATRGRQKIDAALIAYLPKLEIIANFGVGYDSIDLRAATECGIVVTNTPDVLNDEVADFTVGLLLSTIRELPQADRFLRDGKWLRGSYPLTQTLRDRTIATPNVEGPYASPAYERLYCCGAPPSAVPPTLGRSPCRGMQKGPDPKTWPFRRRDKPSNQIHCDTFDSEFQHHDKQHAVSLSILHGFGSTSACLSFHSEYIGR